MRGGEGMTRYKSRLDRGLAVSKTAEEVCVFDIFQKETTYYSKLI